MGTLLFFSIGLFLLSRVNSKTQDYESEEISPRAKALSDWASTKAKK
jgi:hypothetical protein